LEAFDLTLCFLPMLRVGFLDVAVGAFLRHLLERIDERLLPSEDIFQLVLKQFLDAFHGHSHPPCGQSRGSSKVGADQSIVRSSRSSRSSRSARSARSDPPGRLACW